LPNPVARASVTNVPLKSNLALAPGQSYVLNLNATAVTEITWQAIQPQRCPTDCIRMTLLTTPSLPPFSAALGATGKYTPVDGKLSVQYTNISTQPVTINIFHVERTCTAEACKLFDPAAKGRWLVYKIAAFRSISTSRDGSYSTITGTALSGRAFTVRAVWWTDTPASAFHCATFIQRYIVTHAPPEKYSPYILSGQATGEGPAIVLHAIDDCTPSAPHFGVPGANVFK
jgi:hypothetical protein